MKNLFNFPDGWEIFFPIKNLMAWVSVLPKTSDNSDVKIFMQTNFKTLKNIFDLKKIPHQKQMIYFK